MRAWFRQLLVLADAAPPAELEAKMSARNVPGKNPSGAAVGGGGGGGGSAAPPAPADSPKKRPSSGGEAASTHLVQAVLAVTLAVVAWYISVEQPMIRSMSGMHKELMEVRAMQKSKTKEIDDHLERLSATKGAEDFGATVKKYGKEMDKKIKGIRAVVEDSQRQQVLLLPLLSLSLSPPSSLSLPPFSPSPRPLSISTPSPNPTLATTPLALCPSFPNSRMP
jgi:hypothetical protein